MAIIELLTQSVVVYIIPVIGLFLIINLSIHFYNYITRV